VQDVAAQVDTCGLGGVLMARPSLRALAAADWNGALPAPVLNELRRWASIGRRPAAVPLVAAPSTASRSSPAELPAALSGREWEVLERIAAGDSNKLIARAFDLSPHTVKRHVANILDKLGADSRGQAAAWYRRATAPPAAAAARG
jgi:LuxR family maltose regulon positive regulatory protein